MEKGLKTLKTAARPRRVPKADLLNKPVPAPSHSTPHDSALRSDIASTSRSEALELESSPSQRILNETLPLTITQSEALAADSRPSGVGYGVLDLSSLGLDNDADLLRPLEWLSEHRKLQLNVMGQSFYWSERHSYIDMTLEEHQHCLVEPETSRTYHTDLNKPYQSRLTSKPPVQALESSWSHYISVDQLVSHELYSLLCQDRHVQRTTELLLSSRNILLTICQTTGTLIAMGVCTDGFSIFVNHRSQLVELIPISLRRIVGLADRLNCVIDSLVRSYLRGTSIPNRSSFERRDVLSSTAWLASVLKGESPAAQDVLEDTIMLSDLTHCWGCIARVLDLGLISYCASHLTSSEEYYCALDRLGPTGTIDIPGTNLSYSLASLECLGLLTQGCRIWTVCQISCQSIDSAYVSTTISDLADLWGPIWKLEKDQTAENKSHGHYYALGSGIIGAWARSARGTPVTLSEGGKLCHFVSSGAQMDHDIKPLEAQTSSRLIIGVAEAGRLEENVSCRTPRHECFPDKDLRPHGTRMAMMYNSSTTLTFSAGYYGTQIGLSRQYQRRPPITRKQTLLEKWTVAPDKRNPNTLLLWCGLEVSLCTRNARRRRIIQVLGSEIMLPHIERLRWDNAECAKAFKDTLKQDIEAFPKLYISREEWRKELGLAVAQLLNILGSTGVADTGDLDVLTSADSPLDPDKTLRLSARRHTWIGFLRDSILCATFAVTTHLCLSFPYGRHKCSGQVCRCRRRGKGQYTVLETVIAPVFSPGGLKSKAWSILIPSGRKLSLQSSSTEALKVVEYLPREEMLLTWSGSEVFRAAFNRLQRHTMDSRFHERVDDNTNELLTSTAVFIISEKHNDLPYTSLRLSNIDTPETYIHDGQDRRSASSTLFSIQKGPFASSDESADSSMTDYSSPVLNSKPNPPDNDNPQAYGVQSSPPYCTSHWGIHQDINGRPHKKARLHSPSLTDMIDVESEFQELP